MCLGRSSGRNGLGMGFREVLTRVVVRERRFIVGEVGT